MGAGALYTFLAMSWGFEGWLVIGGIVVAASAALTPSVPLAARFAAQHFPAAVVQADPEAEPAAPITVTDADLPLGAAAGRSHA